MSFFPCRFQCVWGGGGPSPLTTTGSEYETVLPFSCRVLFKHIAYAPHIKFVSMVPEKYALQIPGFYKPTRW